MNELLSELPFPKNVAGRVVLWLMFATAILLSNCVQVMISRQVGVAFPVLHVLAWAAWFFWQGVLFLRGRQRALKSGPNGAYRRAFFSHILPGVSIGVSQMTCPVLLAILAGPEFGLVTGVLGAMSTALGLALMISGFRTIGFARAGFLTEFRTVRRPLLHSRVYAWMRHPLFVGGALLSLGGTLLMGGIEQLPIALANLAILPVYQRIEDYRLTQVFGEVYASYVRSVGGVFPRLQSLFVRRA